MNTTKFLKSIAAFVLFLGLLPMVSAQAVQISQVQFTNLRLDKTNFNPGEEVTGKFTIVSAEDAIVSDLLARFRLSKITSDGKLNFDEKIDQEQFFIEAKQQLTRTFSYKLPQNLPGGEYELRIRLYNSKGVGLGWVDTTITVEGNAEFLTLNNNWLSKGQEQISPEGAAVLEKNEALKFSFDVSNTTDKEIKAEGKISVYKFSVNGNLVKEIKTGSASLKPGETKTLSADLTGLELSDSYFAKAAMFSGKNQISNSVNFSWQVAGEEFEILQILSDKPSYIEGDMAKIQVTLVRAEPAPEGKRYLTTSVYDEKGKLAGEKTEEISESGTFVFEIPISREAAYPKLKAAITNENNQLLDDYELVVAFPPKMIPWAGIIIGILVAFAVFVAGYFLRKRYLAKRALVPLAVCLFVLVPGFVFAYEIDGRSSGNLRLDWNRPETINTIYEAGSNAVFDGEVRFENPSQQSLSNNSFEFFVANRTAPTISGGRIVTGANIVKIGEILNVCPSPGCTTVEYNEIIFVPESAYSIPGVAPNGQGRFYVQYRGQDPSGNTQWFVAHQDVKIQENGENGFDIQLEVDQREGVIVGQTLNFTLNLWNRSACIVAPFDVMLVVDESGSMESCSLQDCLDANRCSDDLCRSGPSYQDHCCATGKATGTRKMDMAARAVDSFLDYLATEVPNAPRVGLVSFEGGEPDQPGDPDATMLRQSLTTNYSYVKNAFAGLTPYDSTCIQCGLDKANRNMSVGDGRLKYEVLLGDGVGNRFIFNWSGAVGGCGDPRDPFCFEDGSYIQDISSLGEPLGNTLYRCSLSGRSWEETHNRSVAVARQAAANNITVHSLGFTIPGDPGWAPDVLEDVADAGGGIYLGVAESEAQLTDYFRDLAGIMSGASLGTRAIIEIPLQLDFVSADPRCYLVGNNLICDLGDINCQDSVPTINFQAKVNSRANPGQEIVVTSSMENDAGKRKESNQVILSVFNNNPPDRPIQTVMNSNFCDFGRTNPAINTVLEFNWRYDDDDLDRQKYFQIEINNVTNPSAEQFNAVIRQEVEPGDNGIFWLLDKNEDGKNYCQSDSGKSCSSFVPPVWDASPGFNLNWGNTYSWRVRVWDTVSSQPSEWSQLRNFTMPAHAYPSPDFKIPSVIYIGKPTLIEDRSKCYNAAGSSYDCKQGAYASYNWDFGNGSVSQQKGDASTVYYSEAQYTVTLRVGDGGGYCSIDKTMGVKDILPTWIEVSPGN